MLAYCKACSYTYNDFLKTGYLSCAQCYTSFASKLEPLIERYHGSISGKKVNAYHYAPELATQLRSHNLSSSILNGQRIYTQNNIKKHESATKEFKQNDRIHNINSNIEKSTNITISSHTAILGSMRLRVARNLQGLPYWQSLSPLQQKRCHNLFIERGISATFANDYSVSVYTGEEDHLRYCWVHNINIVKESEIWEQFEKYINFCLHQIEILDKMYEWQFNTDYGYLTACPALCGWGIRLSFQLYIPYLLRSNSWLRWQKNLNETNCELRLPSRSAIPNLVGKRNEEYIQISNRHWGLDCNPKEEGRYLLQLVMRAVQAEKFSRKQAK